MKILLIDDHEMFSESLKYHLEKNEKICKVDILEDIGSLNSKIVEKYDVTLMDINMRKIFGDKDGLILTEELLKDNKNLKIVILSGFDMPGFQLEAKKIGARGFVSKDEKTDILIEKLVKVGNGELIFEKINNDFEELTKGEKKIVELYSSGLTRKEVAKNCHMSVSSLAVSLNRIYSKLYVNNYQEMVNKALELGYIKPNFF